MELNSALVVKKSKQALFFRSFIVTFTYKMELNSALAVKKSKLALFFRSFIVTLT